MQRIIYSVVLLYFCIGAFATHNNAGEIIYRYIGNGSNAKFEITIITYTDPNSAADRDTLTLDVSSCDLLNTNSILVGRDSIIPFTATVRKNIYTLDSYTFPAAQGCYILSMQDPNRISGITNISGSVNVEFYLEDTLKFLDPQFFGFNSSPVLTEPPIDFAKVKDTFIHNPGAYDPDGDSLIFELIPPKRNPNTNVPNYFFPNQHSCPPIANSFEIDRFTGELVWAVPCQVGIYNVAILIREYREGRLIGTMIRDMQIRVTDNLNEPPVISNHNDTCVIAGEPLEILVKGTDEDIDQTLTLTANGGPLFIKDNPATFQTSPSKSPVFGQFKWNTDCSNIRPGFYTVVFKVSDNFMGPNNNPQPYVDIETWAINVVGPPPDNLTATAGGDQVILNWDNPYSCASADNFRGFTIWRKQGCDSLQLDTCQTGGLGQLGYQKISGPNPVTTYTYKDNNVVNGVVYSYRVVPIFAEAVSDTLPWQYNEVAGLPSNEACVQLKQDVPIITNVDVQVTDVNAGVIDVKWLNADPNELDTIQNPGPYKYEVVRYLGMGTGGASILAQTFTSNTFSDLDTFFTDINLNTEDNPYSYQIRFYATGVNGFYEIGKSDSASSIFLTVNTGSNQLQLSWSEQVPWDNYRYVVYKETAPGSGTFDSIATTTSTGYLDKTVTNGREYCYRIKGYGSYYNSGIIDPLVNFSQRACAVPRDTVAPCAPGLTVSNDCETGILAIQSDNLKNILTWNNPNNSCADDVVRYNVYYAPTNVDELELLAEMDTKFDTVYTHNMPVNSLAGCYAVTAIDSFGNESVLSDMICVDNCPIYELPNVFTPNGDGHNDLYHPFLPYYFVDHIEIKIFNRWGNQVFRTTDPDIMWDGTDQETGKPLSEGVYFYVCDVYEIRLTGVEKRTKPLSGYIHIILGNGNTN